MEWGLFAIVFLRCEREEAPDRDRQKAIRDSLLDLRFVSQVHRHKKAHECPYFIH